MAITITLTFLWLIGVVGMAWALLMPKEDFEDPKLWWVLKIIGLVAGVLSTIAVGALWYITIR